MDSRSRSTLFLMEQLIVILIFAVCAAICVEIFAGAFTMARSSRDMSGALLRAESAAECYKAFLGDRARMAGALGGVEEADSSLAVYYDKNWQVCDRSGAAYVMRVGDAENTEYAPDILKFADITVAGADGEDLITLTVATRGEAG